MKVAILNRRPVTLYTITDMARALGLIPASLWQSIYHSGTFPAPTMEIGKRVYYTQKDMDELTAATEEAAK